jgi:hypothetical protein
MNLPPFSASFLIRILFGQKVCFDWFYICCYCCEIILDTPVISENL